MPELPEVETVRRGLAPAMEGARFTKVEVRRSDLRWPLAKDFARRLEGRTVTCLTRRAKYLLADLSSGEVLLMHLGMSGSFHVFYPHPPLPARGERAPREARRVRGLGRQSERSGKAPSPGSLRSPPSPCKRGEGEAPRSNALAVGKPEMKAVAPEDEGCTLGRYYHERAQHLAHDHVVFHMSSGAVVTFNDPRRFGSMKIIPRVELASEPLLARLGLEPLGSAFDAVTLAKACKGKKTNLKAALSDQRVVAGLGNIYVCEALHRAQLSPKRLAATIAGRAGSPTKRAERLVEGIKAVLDEAIKDGGSSLRDHKLTDGELGMFQHHFRVYDRAGEKCRTAGCRGTVKRIVQNGRSTFYCPVCQK